MQNKSRSRYVLAFAVRRKVSSRVWALFRILEQADIGSKELLTMVEEDQDETEKELMFLPLNLLQLLEDKEDGDKRRIQWAEFASKYGETVTTVATLGWTLAAAPYEQAIWRSAVQLMRHYGLGEVDYSVPEMVLLYIAEREGLWRLIWGLDAGPEVRIEMEVNVLDDTARIVI